MSVDFARRESIYFSQMPVASDNVRVCRVAHEWWSPRFRVRRPESRAVGLAYVLAGQAHFHTRKERHLLNPGTVACFGPGSPYRLWCNPVAPAEILIVAYVGKRILETTRDSLGSTCVAVRPDNPNDVLDLMQRLFDTAKANRPLAEEICTGLIPVLLMTIQSGLAGAPVHQSLGQAAYYECRRYIDGHFRTLASVAEAATASRVSHAHMCRLFKRYAKVSPHHYLLRLKMNYAAHLLMESDQSIKEIADMLGFSDPYAFSKTFKRLLGMAPKHYRER